MEIFPLALPLLVIIIQLIPIILLVYWGYNNNKLT